MGRESIAMTREELNRFLEQTHWVIVGTLGEAGEPSGTVASCSLSGNRLVFTLPEGPARRNIERDPRVCCAADEYPAYYQIRGMTAHGIARPAEAPAALLSEGCRAYSIDLDDVMSFDFAKIRGRV